mmetsp:Transcript_28503/g.41985  ORF Transcript_28503/g.41985 Transcript_28503/m.41985 type:complete len:131 (-) Transcript_28503:140-532(-)
MSQKTSVTKSLRETAALLKEEQANSSRTNSSDGNNDGLLKMRPMGAKRQISDVMRKRDLLKNRGAWVNSSSSSSVTNQTSTSSLQSMNDSQLSLGASPVVRGRKVGDGNASSGVGHPTLSPPSIGQLLSP